MSDTAVTLPSQVAVVTGATRGLGRAMAIALARSGTVVVLAGRTTTALQDTAKQIEAAGSTALVVPTDITDPHAVQQLASRTIDHCGQVDIIVNNSGAFASTPVLEQSVAEWDTIYDTNVRGTFLVTREFGKHLVTQRSGKVVNVASNFAYKGIVSHAAYSSSKAAVIAFTRSLAVEWAPYNIQVNALAPGYFATELTAAVREDEAAYARVVRAVPARRIGEPDELGPWLELLVGPASDFITGQTIVIDGGQTSR